MAPRAKSKTKTGLATEVKSLRERVQELESSERTPQESDDRFRLILERSVQGILVHRHFKALFANQALADLYGYEPLEQILALESTRLLIVPLQEYGEAYESRLNGEDVPRDIEIRGRRKNWV